ncbi:MAG TPA: cysteine--tRNA ligase [Candidatus Saccharimonadales bacterium]|jgi:cysteinyl-tRNA synthetase
MKLYNTLTRQIDTIEPLNAPTVTVYTCGPTVYDYAHIGHWFNYIRMDILIRTLRQSGMRPEWVMNITDVGHLVSDADDGEDKLEKGARREGKTAWEVAEFYTKDFLDCMKLLNISKPDHITKATDHIAEQIALIERLTDKGYTYIISDGVYFDTSKFESYAAFARLDLEGQQAGARVEYNTEKRNPTDFALWKFSPAATEGNGDKRRDMEWESPWGIGFPGWHIECSAMSMKYLGDTIDIHTGGIDHVPVHHTNEIAQSEAATGKRFANYWMHGNHVMAEGNKISKSLGNGIRLQDILKKGISAQTVRLHVLESHYRSQSLFSMAGLEAAHNRLQSYQAMADVRWQDIPGAANAGYIELLTHTLPKLISNALQHDLNTPQVLAILSEYETQLRDGYTSQAKDVFESFLSVYIYDALGIDLLASSDISDEQKNLIAERTLARADKNWAQSDQLREAISAQGIGIRDAGDRSLWYRL